MSYLPPRWCGKAHISPSRPCPPVPVLSRLSTGTGLQSLGIFSAAFSGALGLSATGVQHVRLLSSSLGVQLLAQASQLLRPCFLAGLATGSLRQSSPQN